MIIPDSYNKNSNSSNRITSNKSSNTNSNNLFNPTVLQYLSDEAKQKLAWIDTTGFVSPSFGSSSSSNNNNKILKDECVLSCDTAFSPDGLFLSLATLESVGWDFVPVYVRLSGCSVFLHLKSCWKLADKEVNSSSSNNDGKSCVAEGERRNESNIDNSLLFTSRLIHKQIYSIFLFDQNIRIPLNDDKTHQETTISQLQLLGCSEFLSRLIKSIIDFSPSHLLRPDSPWKEDVMESKFSQLIKQVENPAKIPNTKWKCSRCSREENLWMNLTDGFIGCGRKIYGVSESGCLDGAEGAALTHYQQDQQNRPLAVRLGTISATATDVFSYAEDSLVHDSLLVEHLAHFGIDVNSSVKTVKSIAEMEIEYNKNYDWSKITEANVELKILQGINHVGLHNFGNSCYVNSSIQLLSAVPHIRDFCLSIHPQLVGCLQKDCLPLNEDLLIQFSKLVVALSTDRYIKQNREMLNQMEAAVKELYVKENPNDFIIPFLFNLKVLRGHKEFSTGRQQDVEEFLRYFFKIFESALQDDKNNTSSSSSSSRLSKDEKLSTAVFLKPEHKTMINDLFGFKVEEQLRQVNTSKVACQTLDEIMLSLPLPPSSYCETAAAGVSAAGPAEEEEQEAEQGRQAKKPKAAIVTDQEPVCSIQESLSLWSAGESAECKNAETQKTVSVQITRAIKSFPPFLIVQLKRFYVGSNWTACKIVAPVTMPTSLDLSNMRATGLKPGDVEWIRSEAVEADDDYKVDEDLVGSIQAVGFSRNAALRSIKAAGPNPILENCVEWVLMNLDQPDIDSPLIKPSNSSSIQTQKQKQKNSSLIASAELIQNLMDLGLTEIQSKAALLSNDGDLSRSSDWFFDVGTQMSNDDFSRIITAAQEKDEAVAAVPVVAAVPAVDAVAAVSGSCQAVNSNEYRNAPKLVDVDGEGKYELLCFISHMGSNANAGHYVCHKCEEETTETEQETGDQPSQQQQQQQPNQQNQQQMLNHDQDQQQHQNLYRAQQQHQNPHQDQQQPRSNKRKRWVIFNDRKVAESQKPPLNLGYLYLYKRIL